MFIFLYISATGVINEVVVLIILTFGKQQLIAPWMVFNIVANVSTTFAPFVLTPGFFRFGYALPMYNAYEAVKVVFLILGRSFRKKPWSFDNLDCCGKCVIIICQSLVYPKS